MGRLPDRLAGYTHAFKDGRRNAFGEQAGQQMVGVDFFRPTKLGLGRGPLQAYLQPGGGLRHTGDQHRLGALREALPCGLLADPQPGADIGPGAAGLAGLSHEVIQQPITDRSNVGDDSDRRVQPAKRVVRSGTGMYLRHELVEYRWDTNVHPTTLRCRQPQDKTGLPLGTLLAPVTGISGLSDGVGS
jgi:hypothetical protein